MIKVVAQFFIREDETDKALALARELVQATRPERGCVQYDICQNLENPTHIAFIEEWESQEDLDAHFQTPHFTNLLPKLQAITDREAIITLFNKL